MRTIPLRPDVQGLRAIAVALVVLEHAEILLPGGFIGVDVFFVISGFVITPLIVRELESGSFDHRRFIVKRARRLLPSAGVVLAATAVGTALLLSPFGTQQQAAATGAAAAVSLSNIALYAISADYFSEHVRSNPFLHTWSLGVEEQFFLVFPVVLVLAWRFGRQRRSVLVATLLVVALASACLAWWAASSASVPGVSSPRNAAFYLPLTRAWEFAVGALLTLVTRSGRPHPWRGALAAGGMAVIVGSTLVLEPGAAWPGPSTLLPVLGAAAVIVGGLGPNAVSSALSSRPATWVGDRSYTLYLWHWPLLVFAERLWPDAWWPVITAIVAAVVLAALTTHFVERPFRSTAGRPPRSRPVRSAGAFVASAVAMLSTVGLFAGSTTAWGVPQVAAGQDQLLARPAGYDACLSTTPVSQRDLAPCTWGDTRGLPVYLLGDSNAQQYTEALIGATEALGAHVTVATWGGCSLLDVPLIRRSDAGKGAECALYADDTVRWLLTRPRGVVVMASSGEMVASAQDAFRDSDGNLVRDPQRKAALWEDALVRRIAELERSGFRVVLARTAPHFPGRTREWWHPVECANDVVFTDVARCATSAPEQQLAHRQRLVLQAESEAVERTGVSSYDIWPDVCPDGRCTTHAGTTWIYRDGLHISPRFSRSLADDFARLLTAVTGDHAADVRRSAPGLP